MFDKVFNKAKAGIERYISYAYDEAEKTKFSVEKSKELQEGLANIAQRMTGDTVLSDLIKDPAVTAVLTATHRMHSRIQDEMNNSGEYDDHPKIIDVEFKEIK